MSDLPAQYDVISIGDSTIDTFIRVHEASVECDLDKRNCKICVPYGAKIPVDSISYGVAGNAANVAVGFSRLGIKTAIYTNLGDDDQGKRIKKQLSDNGVSDEYIIVNPNKSSNLSVVLTYQGERTIFVYHQDWFYVLPKLKPTSWIYLTSVAASFTNSNIMDDVCHYVDKTNTKIIYNPGTFQLQADVKRFPRILEMCQILIVNLEEAKKILEIAASDFMEVRDILSKLLLLGPKITVVTDGAEGSYATDGHQYLKAGILSVKVYEKTGAGDAYASGFSGAIIKGKPLGEAMVWGTINSANAISVAGPQKGLLTMEEIEKKRKEFSSFEAGSL